MISSLFSSPCSCRAGLSVLLSSHSCDTFACRITGDGQADEGRKRAKVGHYLFSARQKYKTQRMNGEREREGGEREIERGGHDKTEEAENKEIHLSLRLRFLADDTNCSAYVLSKKMSLLKGGQNNWTSLTCGGCRYRVKDETLLKWKCTGVQSMKMRAHEERGGGEVTPAGIDFVRGRNKLQSI